MSKIRVLILEDDLRQGAQIKAFLEEKAYEVTAIVDSLTAALGAFYAQKPDLVIIDIYLDGKPDGIVFAERIMENPATVKPFVFLTSAIDQSTFESARLTQPYSYLIKPFNALELHYSLELAQEKFSKNVDFFSTGISGASAAPDNFLLVKKKDSLFKVYFDDISFIKVDGKYATLVTQDETFLIEMSLKLLLQQLPGKHFVQVHRNYVVNVLHIKKLHLTDYTLELVSGSIIGVSRRFKEQFLERYTIFK